MAVNELPLWIETIASQQAVKESFIQWTLDGERKADVKMKTAFSAGNMNEASKMLGMSETYASLRKIFERYETEAMVQATFDDQKQKEGR
jgi:hypothetical protein